MRLQPTQPPGRRSRRARAYASEITRLHAQGYSLDGIRQAMAEAGLVVSRSTVRRELMRPPAPVTATPAVAPPSTGAAPPMAQMLPAALNTSSAHVPTEPTSLAPDHRPADGETSARDFAASFMKGRHTNPFIRNRS